MAGNPAFREHTEIAHAMKGIDFPARRDDILEAAKANGAEGEAIDNLSRIPDHDYDNVAQVMQALNAG